MLQPVVSSDPIRIGALPTVLETELDHRGNVVATTDAIHHLRYTLIGMVAAVIPCTVVFRLLGPYVDSPLALSLFTLVGFVLGIFSYFGGSTPYGWLFNFVAGPTLWALFIVTKTENLLLLLLIALILTAFTIHAVVEHYSSYLSTNPYLDRATRRWWQNHWWGPSITDTERVKGLVQKDRLYELLDCDPFEEQEKRRYLFSYFIIPVAYALAVLVFLLCPPPLVGGQLAILTLLVVFFAYGCFNLYAYANATCSPYTLSNALFVIQEALGSFFTYWVEHVPGRFRTPAGPLQTRRASVTIAIVILTLAALPTASYFPVMMLATGPGPWLPHAETAAWPLKTAKPPPPYTGPLELSTLEQSYLDQLPSRNAKDQYRKQLRLRRARELQGFVAEPTTPYARLTATPESWPLYTLKGALTGDPFFIWSSILTISICLLAPLLLLSSMCFAIMSRTLLHHYVTLEATCALYHPPPELKANTYWEAIVRRIQESADPIERESLFLGFTKQTGMPVYLDRAYLHQHAHILGDSGSFKTSLGLAPLVNQLLRTANTPGDTASVVIIDLKGDAPLFHEARLSAERAGIPFKFFSDQVGYRTHIFNPFSQSYLASLTKQQRAEVIIQALGLDYGEDYGPSYYSAQNRDLLNRVFQAYPDLSSFQRMLGYLSGEEADFLSGISKKQKEDSIHVTSVTRYLAAIHPLNACSDSTVPSYVSSLVALEQQIDMHDVVTKPHVVYFYLPSLISGGAARECGKLALYTLLTAADRAGPRTHRTYAFVDEFQKAVSRNLATILEQARSKKVAMIVANHTISQLRQFDMNSVIQANTRFRQYFSASDLNQQDELIKASGEGITVGYEWNMAIHPTLTDAQLAEAPSSLTTGIATEVIDERNKLQAKPGPRHTRNTIIDMTDDEMANIVHITRSRKGSLAQYMGHHFVNKSLWHIPKTDPDNELNLDTYTGRDNTPPMLDPRSYPGTVTVDEVGTREDHPVARRTGKKIRPEAVARPAADARPVADALPVADAAKSAKPTATDADTPAIMDDRDDNLIARAKALADKKKAEAPWLDKNTD